MTIDNCIISASVFRKSDWARVGGYCEDFKDGFEDWDFYLSLLDAGLEYHHLNEIVYYYRRHGHNMTDRLDRDPALKEKIFAFIYRRHPMFYKQHAHEATRFLYAERSRQRAFGKIPLIAFCRKLLRTFENFPDWTQRQTQKRFGDTGFVVLAILAALVVFFIVCFSGFGDNAATVTSGVNIELTREATTEAADDDPVIVYGMKADGKRLPLAFVNFSRSGELPLAIRPLGKSSPDANGQEIWLLSRYGTTEGLLPRAEGEAAGWRFITETWLMPALVSVGGEQPLKFFSKTESQMLLFMRHAWSGRCEISSGGVKTEFDLHNVERNAILPVLLLSLTNKGGGMTNPIKMSLQLPKDSIARIGLVGLTESKWSISQITDDQGRKLEVREGKDVYLMTTSSRSQTHWLFVIPAGILGLLTLYGSKTRHVSSKLYYAYAILLALTVTSFFLMVFYPGTWNSDALDQWSQAKTGYYNDWHPIGLTMLMAVCQKLMPLSPENVPAALCALINGFIFWFSLYFLIGQSANSKKQAIWLSLIATCNFTFWICTVTLWKDVATAGGVLILCGVVFYCLRNASKQTRLSQWLCYGVVLWLPMIWMLLNRQTSWVIILLMSPFIVMAARSGLRLRILLLFAGCWMSAMFSHETLNRTLGVKRAGNLANLVLSYDLVGTLNLGKADTSYIDSLHTTKIVGQDKMGRAINDYKALGGDYLWFGDNPPFSAGNLLENNCVIRDLPRVAKDYPFALMKHKFYMQKQLLGLDSSGAINYPFEANVDAFFVTNIKEDSKIPSLKSKIIAFLGKVSRTPGTLLQIPYHLKYVAMIMLAIMLASYLAVRRDRILLQQFKRNHLLAGAAFACWLPMLVALPVPSWRYMLPSTVMMVVSILLSMGLIVTKLSEHSFSKGMSCKRWRLFFNKMRS
jgi:hypothetical protein